MQFVARTRNGGGVPSLCPFKPGHRLTTASLDFLVFILGIIYFLRLFKFTPHGQNIQ